MNGVPEVTSRLFVNHFYTKKQLFRKDLRKGLVLGVAD